MDNKEAIYYLQYLRHNVHANSPYDAAIVTAINALSETAPPKSNADRIRQMTDEELAEWFAGYFECRMCALKNVEKGCNANCKAGAMQWLKQEVSEDAGSKTD